MQNPFLRRPDNPNYLRRCFHHDYTRPGRYMITLSKSDLIGAFVTISGTPQAPRILLSATGLAFESALAEWKTLYPQILVPSYQIMPDHIHLCLEVNAPLQTGLSRAIARLMGRTTNALNGGANTVSAFARGFNDRIAYNSEQWERQKTYVADNPRRYLARKFFPEYFRRVQTLTLKGKQYALYGNLFLLNHPSKTVVRFSRRYSPEMLVCKQRKYEEAMRSGGVLVSPFIHANEKAVKEQAIRSNASIIQIVMNGFPERFKPTGCDFELCASGRLLLIGPSEHNTRKVELDRGMAMAANALAEFVAALPSSSI